MTEIEIENIKSRIYECKHQKTLLDIEIKMLERDLAIHNCPFKIGDKITRTVELKSLKCTWIMVEYLQISIKIIVHLIIPQNLSYKLPGLRERDLIQSIVLSGPVLILQPLLNIASAAVIRG